MAGPEPPGSARHATTLNRPAPEVSNLSPVPAHYGISPDPKQGEVRLLLQGRLEASRAREMTEQMMAAGLPV